ncbi:MAG: sigma-54-dependent Fis family transcriptional regulator [Desulfobulbaceae bacterium]|nr:sigma-54-dependent Fis family transcriptional regulator [Desulfobulbaceae bacterium]
MTRNRLLIVDDETDMRNGLQRLLSREFPGLQVVTLPDAEQAISYCEKETIDLALLDIKMPGMNGLDLLKYLLGKDPWLTAVMMTGYGSIETAVEAIKLGAYDFITKPFEKEVIFRTLSKAIERNRLLRENSTLKQQICEKPQSLGFTGQSPAFLRFRDNLEAVARTNYTVLVRGESGTGKELTARAIHQLSDRRAQPLIMVNCPAIPEQLLESELFGYVRGAFTNANQDQEGLFSAANGGTLCLDEIGDLPFAIQSKLLRVLQEREIKPLGSTRTIKVDVRIIALTNLNLEKMIADRLFREDLFYRLNAVTLVTPSLAEMIDDIPLLVAQLTKKVCAELDLPLKRFDQWALTALMSRAWPGNVRELENVVRRAVIFSPKDLISVSDIHFIENPPKFSLDPTSGEDFMHSGTFEAYKDAKDRIVDDFTCNYVAALLKKTGGNVSQGAKLSGISRVALQKIMKRRHISGAEYR